MRSAPGAGELADREDRRELPDRRRDEQHVGGEREERAERDAAVSASQPPSASTAT